MVCVYGVMCGGVWCAYTTARSSSQDANKSDYWGLICLGGDVLGEVQVKTLSLLPRVGITRPYASRGGRARGPGAKRRFEG